MKLHAIYVGGDMKGANIELHDMRFIIAETIEQTYDALRDQWWGTPESLHIDCWAELSQVDGYDITLSYEPYHGAEKLFYVNLGGYDLNEFTELHKNMFVVAQSESKAKISALKTVRHWQSFHRDNLYQAEKAFLINDATWTQGLNIHLVKSDVDAMFKFHCKYICI